MTDADANDKMVKAATVFSPRSPVYRRAFFAGRSAQMNALADAVSQIGLHAVIFGERGVGKSSLGNITQDLLDVMDKQTKYHVIRVNANREDTFSTLWAKAMNEVKFEHELPRLGFNQSPHDKSVFTLQEAAGAGDQLSIDDVLRALSLLKNSVVVIDEFDRLPRKHIPKFTDLIKALSDKAIPSTVVLVGIADTVDGLIRDHLSISRALVQINMPRMSDAELGEILSKAGEALGMTFNEHASSRIARMSQGLPHFTHLVGQNAVRNACARRDYTVTLADVDRGFAAAVKQTDHSMTDMYATATHSAHSAALFKPVLLACAITAGNTPENAMGYFQATEVMDPLKSVLGKNVQIATFIGHLTEFASEKRAKVLERTGNPRTYRYRFLDPLLAPYVILRGIADNLITAAKVESLLNPPTP